MLAAKGAIAMNYCKLYIVWSSRERIAAVAGDKTLETFGTGTNAVSCENTEI